jgi:hypothetical protein
MVRGLAAWLRPRKETLSMTDPTNTQAAHPAIVTATGVAQPPAADPTNTDAAHPATVSRPGPAAQTG